MLRAFKYRIYPTSKQAELINKHIGSCRFVYNLALECKQMAYAGSKVNLSCFDLIKQLPDLKEQCEWLNEINSQSLQQSITHLDNAFTNFFKGRSDFPKFKKKTARQSFNIPQSVVVDFKNEKLIIPKFRKKGIDIVLHRKFKGEIKQATISRTATGKYFVSVLVDTTEKIKKQKTVKEKTAVGIDLGIKSFIVTSDGLEINNPNFLRKSESKLKFLQSKFSKHKGKRTKYKLAKAHEKVTNQRMDFLQKTSTELINNHDSFCIEDLNISGMVKNHNLAKSISDSGWGMFVSMLEYKAKWHGKNILMIGRFDPSSKTCSCCGKIKHDLKLEDRIFKCEFCNLVLDRDVNAAINIKNFALRNYVSGTETKTRNELPTLVGVITSEVPLPKVNG